MYIHETVEEHRKNMTGNEENFIDGYLQKITEESKNEEPGFNSFRFE